MLGCAADVQGCFVTGVEGSTTHLMHLHMSIPRAPDLPVFSDSTLSDLFVASQKNIYLGVLECCNKTSMLNLNTF